MKLIDVSGLRNSDVPLIERYHVALPSVAMIPGSRLLLPMSICTIAQKSPFTAAERQNPIHFEYRWLTDGEVTLALRDGYDVESLPAATKKDLNALAFQAQYERNERKVRFTRHLAVDAALIDRGKYGLVRDFFNGIAAADQQQIVLRKLAQP